MGLLTWSEQRKVERERQGQLDKVTGELHPAFAAVVSAAEEAGARHRITPADVEVFKRWRRDLENGLGLASRDTMNERLLQSSAMAVVLRKASFLAVNLIQGHAILTVGDPPVIITGYSSSDIVQQLNALFLLRTSRSLGSTRTISKRYQPVSRKAL